jgi:hypothetical protein
MLVVDYLFAHVDGSSVSFEGALDRLDCTVNAGAVTAGRSE